MKIRQWDAKDTDKHKCQGGIMIMATTEEALRIIKSLAHQIEKSDDFSDDRRAEFILEGGQYFSIAVVYGDEDVIFHGEKISNNDCPNALLPDGPICPRCGNRRGPSGVDGGSWVHY